MACGSVERDAVEDFTLNAQMDLRKTNLCPMSKLNDTHLTIHPFSRLLKWNDLAVVGYTDAAQGDRRVDHGTVQNSLMVT